MIIAEIKFSNISVKMALAAMLIHPHHPALEHAIETLNSIGMDDTSPILAGAVSDEIMLSEMLA